MCPACCAEIIDNDRLVSTLYRNTDHPCIEVLLLGDAMLPKLREAKYRGDYRIWLRFADGVEGEVDLKNEL